MKQKVSVYGAIVKEGKLLVLHRHVPDVWELPGGKMEYGEHPIQAVKREVKEETGFDAEVKEEPLVGSSLRPDGMHEIVIVYPCRILNEDTDVRLYEVEHFEFKWVSYDELLAIKNLATSLNSVLNGIKKWIR